MMQQNDPWQQGLERYQNQKNDPWAQGAERYQKAKNPELAPQGKENETTNEQIGRLATGTASRIGEGAGILGNFQEGLGNLFVKGYENLSFSGKTPKLEDASLKGQFDQLFNQESEKQREAPQWMKNAAGLGRNTLGKEGTAFPTSRELRELSAKASGGYTEPKDEKEATYYRFVEDMRDLTAVPQRFRMNLGRRALVAGAGEGAQEATKALGGGEKAQAEAKMASMLFFSMLNPGGAQRYTSQLFDRARQGAANIPPQNMSGLYRNLDAYENQLMRTNITTPEKTAVLKPLRELRENIANNNGRLQPTVLFDAKQEINALRSKFFQETTDPMARRVGQRYFRNLMRSVDRSIENSLRNTNPQALEQFQGANQAWSTLHNSQRTTRMINRYMPKAMRGSAIAGLFEIAASHPGMVAKATGAGLAGLGVVSGARILHRIMNSPTLARYYGNVLQNAAAGNVTELAKDLNKLNDHYELEEKNKKVKR